MPLRRAPDSDLTLPVVPSLKAVCLSDGDPESRPDQRRRGHGQSAPERYPDGASQDPGAASGRAKTAKDGERQKRRDGYERELICEGGASMATRSGHHSTHGKGHGRDKGRLDRDGR